MADAQKYIHCTVWFLVQQKDQTETTNAREVFTCAFHVKLLVHKILISFLFIVMVAST